MVDKARRKVAMLDLRAQYESIAVEVDEALRSVFNSQQFILGPEVEQFEQELARYCGCKEGVGCASGSDALLLALMACGVGPGDEVVTTPFTFFATAGSVVRLGARPVFVDIERGTFNIDPEQVKRAIGPRTKAIIPVHLFGQCADMEAINGVGNKHGISVIEDAAQAIGAEFRGRRAGSLGLMAAFSFYPSKNLGGAGDGGMLTTNDAEIAERLRCYRAHGAKKKYYHEFVGINSRLDSLQAAILRVKLRYLDEWAQARRRSAYEYRDLFHCAGLVESEKVGLPVEGDQGFHVYNQFVIRVQDRDSLRVYLENRGIGTEIYYPLPLHLQACFSGLGYREGDFPESERAAREVLAIPIYPELRAEGKEYIVGRIAAFYS